MIVVADSGSTKCDWIISSVDEEVATGTMGFNPFFHSTELIAREIGANEVLSRYSEQIKAVYFYGAGCSSAERNAIVRAALISRFPNAEILVDHDLTAAALATRGDKPGIACILGTGSNSCYFDGEKVREEVPALGYVLGDEGSGAYFGKILLREYLYKRLPTPLQEEFGAAYDLEKEKILRAVYREPNPNVYLASFMRFVSNRRDHPYFKDLIYKGLANFAQAHILCFPEYRVVPVSFVGSIAHYFSEVLEEVARNFRFEMGTIQKKPIRSLLDYHKEKRSVQL